MREGPFAQGRSVLRSVRADRRQGDSRKQLPGKSPHQKQAAERPTANITRILTVSESQKLKEINDRLAWARHHRNQLAGIAKTICDSLELQPGTDHKDIERCVYGRITFEEAMRRIKNRKLDELSAVLIADNEE
jgi:hypothetical protein